MNATPGTSLEKGSFPVAVKALIHRDNELLILHDVFGDWDLPGGRLLSQEFGQDIKQVITRKISEELGNQIDYKIGNLCTYFQVERIEHDTGNLSQIFGLGFTTEYLDGDINLGPHHDKFVWVNLTDFRPSDYFKHGWEIGLEKFLEQHDLGSM